MNQKYDKVLKFINSEPVMLSLLYDLDLLPEQLEEDSKDWHRMILIAAHFKSYQDQLTKS